MDSIDTSLGLKRHFTTKGVHPYDEIEWDLRDAKITSYIDGSVAFEQKDVEFPVSWSQNATNIVAQKYFNGTPGQSNRESSLRQLIDRVADTITKHGQSEKYFVSEDEAEVFNSELKHILVNQKAAFNSPVWFNIGAKGRSQQASACFILHVEDTMESILNWYREEGMIFKGGSGAGVNISTLRSSYETLSSSGGKSSGPVSFMRGADSVAGTIKSGGKTRRAAKMVILNIDHPDVEEFIATKVREENKIRALREAGFDMDLDGKDTYSVQYQNANNSVRVSDAFMQAVQADQPWDLKAVKTGEVMKTVSARQLWQDIAEAAWACADPGMQFDTTINHWHTASNTGRINGSNPCSEYMHLDNSACNLASLNLLKFLRHDGSFDVVSYKQAVEIIFTAQEILVGYSSYPTESITQTAYDFRQLGLGYANLGALLMALGHAYDSDEGRAWAATLTSIMTGHAYATSAKIARRLTPFAGYEVNKQPMQRVLELHRAEVGKINPTLVPEDLHSSAQSSWDEAVEQARIYGVRNSQATVLAPTGTIGFMMDCDTTGVEPDLALVKLKKLVGGGTMSIVNQTIPRALKNLGFNPDQVKEVIDYIDEHKSIIGAPHVRPEQLSVFACSMGDNVIHYEGHVRMMGAVQPFLSGAISKTVNMPETATVEDVAGIHMLSWELGLKSVAIYRDNCKVGQPLSTGKPKEAKPIEAPVSQPVEAKSKESGFIVRTPVKREMPKVRTGKTFEFSVGGAKGFVTAGEYDDGKAGELFINMAKQGSTLSGLMDAFAISISNGLQYGVPLKFYVGKYMSMSFAPSGITDDAEIPMASSVMDYIFRRLALEYLPYQDLLDLGIKNAEQGNTELQASLIQDDAVDEAPGDAAETETPNAPSQTPQLVPASTAELQQGSKTHDAPLCYNCGNPTQRAGSCHICPACGTTSGCS